MHDCINDCFFIPIDDTIMIGPLIGTAIDIVKHPTEPGFPMVADQHMAAFDTDRKLFLVFDLLNQKRELWRLHRISAANAEFTR
jgi:hypothetical protein